MRPHPGAERPTGTVLGRDGFARLTNVSRETLDRLTLYVELLRSWNRRINLVGRTTIGDVWRRHILDSFQLFPLIPDGARTLVDLGSGAGLPGLVLALLGAPGVVLIESDLRKAAFLREAIRITQAPARLLAGRSDRIAPFPADVITARAVAPLPELLDIVYPFLGAHSICLFLKGRQVDEEVAAATRRWRMTLTRHPSAADPAGVILRLEGLARVS